MDEYGNKKKDILDEISIVTNHDTVIGEYVALHKELIDTRDKLVNNEYFNVIKGRLEALSSFADDVEIRTCSVGEKCPLTQEKIIDPFKSICGHVYERKAIKDYLKKNTNKCPSVGCRGKVQERS